MDRYCIKVDGIYVLINLAVYLFNCYMFGLFTNSLRVTVGSNAIGLLYGTIHGLYTVYLICRLSKNQHFVELQEKSEQP